MRKLRPQRHHSAIFSIPRREEERFRLRIDPSCLTEEDEDRIKGFAERRGFTAEDIWNDWGWYLKISKTREKVI